MMKTTTLVLFGALALYPSAYAATISSFAISTYAVFGTPCSMSGSGPGSASCRSTSSVGAEFFGDATASITLTDNSISLSFNSFHASYGQGSASITHDDIYSVPVNGAVSALVSLVCQAGGANGVGFSSNHFFLGSTSVSPPVENIFTGASQGGGLCGPSVQVSPSPNAFVVALTSINNRVELHTEIDTTAYLSDQAGGLFLQLNVLGFEDANGNAIEATLTPEPGTAWMAGLFFVTLLGYKCLRR